MSIVTFATPEQVKDYFRDFADNSEAAITSEKIQAWLDSAHISVMGRFSQLYETITQENNPESAVIIAEITAMKVVAIVDDILNSYSEGSKKPQWERRANEKLKEYCPDKIDGKQPEPVVKLPDALYTGTRTQKGRISVSATSGAVFKKGVDAW